MVIDNIVEYLNYEVVTKIEVVRESSSDFPTVSFYNLRHNQNFSLEDILIKCNFNDNECSANDFKVK